MKGYDNSISHPRIGVKFETNQPEADVDEKKLEPWGTSGGNKKYYSFSGKQY